MGTSGKAPRGPTGTATPKPRKLSFKEQRELEGMDAAILTAEEKAATLEATLHDPSFYITRSLEAAALSAELEELKARVTRLYARWEELENIRMMNDE